MADFLPEERALLAEASSHPGQSIPARRHCRGAGSDVSFEDRYVGMGRLGFPARSPEEIVRQRRRTLKRSCLKGS